MRFGLLAAVCLASMGGATTVEASPIYNVVLLRPMDDRTQVTPTDINDHGTIIGTDGRRGLRWDGGIGSVDGTFIGPADFQPRSINNSGDIVGGSLLLHNGSLETLPPFRAGSDVHLLAINDPGQVAGYTPGAAGTNHATNWVRTESGWDVIDLQEGTTTLSDGRATELNNAGLSLGIAGSKNSVWGPTGPINVNDLWGSAFVFGGTAYAINDGGDVITSSGTGGTIWMSNGSSAGISPLSGGTSVEPRDLNNDRQVVGTSSGRAFLWDSQNGTRELNSLIPDARQWNVVNAIAINNVGQIAALAIDAAGNRQAVRLDLISPPVILGDVNGDGLVDLTDFGILRAHLGLAGTRADGDLTGDGRIDIRDFGQLKDNFGAAKAAPEPAALVTMLIGAIMLVVHRMQRFATNRRQAVAG